MRCRITEMKTAMLETEKARLILNYFSHTHEALAGKFLSTSPYLEECRKMHRDGYKFSTKVQGFTFDSLIKKYSELLSLNSRWTRHEGVVVEDILDSVKHLISRYVQQRSRSLPKCNVTDNSKIESSSVSATTRCLKNSKSCNQECIISSDTNATDKIEMGPSNNSLFSPNSPDDSFSNNGRESVISYSPSRRDSNEAISPSSPLHLSSLNISSTNENRTEPLNTHPPSSPSSSDTVKVNDTRAEQLNTFSTLHPSSKSEVINSSPSALPSSPNVSKINNVNSEPLNIYSEPYSASASELLNTYPSSSLTSSVTTNIDDERPESLDTCLAPHSATENCNMESESLTQCSPIAPNTSSETITLYVCLPDEQGSSEAVNGVTNAQFDKSSQSPFEKNKTSSLRLKDELTPEKVKHNLPWDLAIRQRLGPEELLTAGVTKRKCNAKKDRKTPKKRKVNDDDDHEDIKKVKTDESHSKLSNRLNLDAGEKRKSDRPKSQPVTERKKRATKNNEVVGNNCESQDIPKSEDTKKRTCKKKRAEEQCTNIREQVLNSVVKKQESLSETRNTDDGYNGKLSEASDPLVLTYTEELVLFNKESTIDSLTGDLSSTL